MSNIVVRKQLNSRGTIQSLQVGRGIAAISVVFHHAAITILATHGEFFGRSVIEYGYLGVDFFFVLSGFIITLSTSGTRKTFQTFLIDRARRVFLPYWPVGIAVAVIYSLLPQLSNSNAEWGWLATLTLLPINEGTALSAAWTLKHELLFYFIFGVAYFIDRMYFVMGLWAAAILLAWLVSFNGHVILALINLEFLMGMLLAVAYRCEWRISYLWLVGILSFTAWCMLGAPRHYSPLFGLGLACVLFYVVQLEKLCKVQLPRGLIFLGTVSYSLYLVHYPLISMGNRVFPYTGLLQLLILAAVSIVGGIIYYFTVEYRVMVGRWPRLNRRRPPAPTATR